MFLQGIDISLIISLPYPLNSCSASFTRIMPSGSTDDVILPPDMPFYQHMDKYLSIKSACLSDYRTEHDIAKELKECSTYLTQVLTKHILDRADKYDPEAIIELAVRYVQSRSALHMLQIDHCADVHIV